MIDLNVHRKYDCETGKSEYQCHMEWLRGLLINMQEIGVDDRYGDDVSSDLVSEIKWLTDRIETAKRENEFINTNNRNAIELTEKEMKVSKLINDIASCLCYPNDSCYPNIKTVAHEFETIFSNSKQVEHIKNNLSENDEVKN